MGTNYYWNRKECPACGHTIDEGLHIGKSSCGWCFSLRVHPDLNILDLNDWIKQWELGGEIRNEYGDLVSVAEMEKIITVREHANKNYPIEFFVRNHAEPGPNNLLRHKIDQFCVKHGSGTWDCCVGEFL